MKSMYPLQRNVHKKWSLQLLQLLQFSQGHSKRFKIQLESICPFVPRTGIASQLYSRTDRPRAAATIPWQSAVVK